MAGWYLELREDLQAVRGRQGIQEGLGHPHLGLGLVQILPQLSCAPTGHVAIGVSCDEPFYISHLAQEGGLHDLKSQNATPAVRSPVSVALRQLFTAEQADRFSSQSEICSYLVIR